MRVRGGAVLEGRLIAERGMSKDGLDEGRRAHVMAGMNSRAHWPPTAGWSLSPPPDPGSCVASAPMLVLDACSQDILMKDSVERGSNMLKSCVMYG
jgi:hypothetical protein